MADISGIDTLHIMTDVFALMMRCTGPCPTVEMVGRHLPRLEMFPVRLYDGLNEEQASSVDDERLYLLRHQGNSFDKMPPSSDAYHQHILRLCLQAGHIWGNVLI